MPKLRPYAVFLAAALAVPCLPVHAQAQPSAPADNAAAPEAAGEAGRDDFIRETRVYFPQSADKFYLEEFKSDSVSSGVALRYGYDGATFAIDVFVYPIGRLSEAKALDWGLNELLRSFEQAQQLGYYRNIDLDRPRDIVIPLNTLVQLRGKQVSYEALRDDKPVVSHAVLAYRSYFLIKARITAPKAEKRSAKQVTQQFIEKLLPALRLHHVGACTRFNKTIAYVSTKKLPPKAERISADGSQVIVKEGKDNTLALAEALMRKADSACSENFDDVDAGSGEKFETLTFPPGAWHDDTDNAGTSAPAQ